MVYFSFLWNLEILKDGQDSYMRGHWSASLGMAPLLPSMSKTSCCILAFWILDFALCYAMLCIGRSGLCLLACMCVRI